MALHEFECKKCGKRVTLVMTFNTYRQPLCICGGETEQVFDKGHGGFKFAYTPGKRTGVYEYDYGKKSTWDLTVPGKYEELKKAGIVGDPFDK
jgi:hypothetical protein